MSVNESEDGEAAVHGVVWNKPFFYFEGHPFTPVIHAIQASKEEIPADVNTISLSLDGTLSSNLEWKNQEILAQEYIDRGYVILWNLELGLFNRLKHSLANQTQFLSLILSLEHFRDTLWKKFQPKTLGLCIYKGSVDFSSQIHWDEALQNNFSQWKKEKSEEGFAFADALLNKIFARDAVAEYLNLLANRMPDELQLFIQLEIEASDDLALEAQLTHRERFDRCHLLISNSRLPTLFINHEAKVGVCLPSYNKISLKIHAELNSILDELLRSKKPFRIIPDVFLMSEWDGLDELVVFSESMSSQNKRVLQGFCAAGGTVFTRGPSLGLAYEISLNT